MKKIKVLECIRQGQIGGGESHLLSLVENLDKNQFEPVVLSFTYGPMIERLQKMEVPVFVIPTLKPFDFTIWKKVTRFVKEQKVGLIHAHGTRANSNIFWAAQKTGTPLIYTIHGWSFHPDQKSIVRNIRIMSEKFLTGRSDLNISVSQSNKETGDRFIGKFNSVVVNNGIDLNRFNPLGEFTDVRKELGIPDEKKLILFAARFTIHKQPITLIKAFANAVKENPALHLLLVGDGDQKKEALEIISSLGIGGHITMQSFRNDMPAVLNSADIFVLPSLWEGLPIGLLEAMAMGKAVIATQVDGTSEIIIHGKNGFLLNTSDLEENLTKALLELSSDDNKREFFSSQAKTTISERFDAAVMTAKIENIYKNVLALKTKNL